MTFIDPDNDSQQENIRQLLQMVEGPACEREGLEETPRRVLKAWQEWTAGYDTDIPGLLKTFADGGEDYDEMVLVRDIPVFSHCEHHLAPFFGTACVGYIPNGRVVGLSKLSRLVDAFARRLQVQERITTQVATALMGNLDAHGAAVLLRCRHLCMESRGVKTHNSETVTSCLLGSMRTSEQRAEFLSLAGG